jgi:hypothetical protein
MAEVAEGWRKWSPPLPYFHIKCADDYSSYINKSSLLERIILGGGRMADRGSKY